MQAKELQKLKNMFKRQVSLAEIFIIELIVLMVLWLSNTFAAQVVTVILGAVFSGVLLFALVSELFERSRVPRRYFYIMLVSVLAFASAWLLFQLIEHFS